MILRKSKCSFSLPAQMYLGENDALGVDVDKGLQRYMMIKTTLRRCERN